MNHDKIEIDHETREYIIDKLVEPYYKETIKNTIEGKKLWRTLGISFETLSKVLVAVGGIVSFSSGYYHSENLSFFAGSISCLSLALLQLSSFSYKENKKQSEELNMLLKKLRLDTIPELERNVETSCNTNTKSCNTNSCNTNSEIYAALKEEVKTLLKEENKTFINDVCNYLVLPITNSHGLKGQLYNLLINKENIEIYNFCNKILKYL
jgi:hypothetical protein